MTTTVLEIIQDILSDGDGDNVNSFNETVESEQVSKVIRVSYDALIDQYDLPSTMTVFEQDASLTAGTLTQFVLPVGITRIQWFKYDITTDSATPQYEIIGYKTPVDFLATSHDLNEANTEVVTQDFNDVEYFITNNKRPRYWTSFDDKTIIFDSYDSGEDGSGLVAAKMQGYGLSRPTLTLDDTTAIDLPQELIGLLRDEAREMFFDLYKDGTTKKVNQMARRSRVRAQRNMHKFTATQPPDNLPDYGRGSPRRTKRGNDGLTGQSGGTTLPSWWPS